MGAHLDGNTLADRAHQFDIHPNQSTVWKAQLLGGVARVFVRAARAETAIVNLKALHAKIVKLALDNNFCKARSSKDY